MSPSTASSASSRSRATPLTSCSGPTCATCACCAAGSTSSRASDTPENAKSAAAFRPPRFQRTSEVLYENLRRVGGVGAGFHRLAVTGQREGFALIERTDAVLVEARFLDLKIGAVQRIRRQLLHRELDGFGRGAEPAIGEACTLLLADRSGEEFGGSVEVERTQWTHGQRPRDLSGALSAWGWDWQRPPLSGRRTCHFRPLI